MPCAFRRYLPAALLLLAIAVVAPLISQASPVSGTVAVVFGPGVDRNEAYSRVVDAGGLPLAIGPVGTMVVARFETAAYRERLRGMGAWLFLNPGLAGCGDLAVADVNSVKIPVGENG